jgi:hypothetical protein
VQKAKPQAGSPSIARAAVEQPEDPPAPRFREEHREVVVHNYKDKDVEVQVNESLPRDCEFLQPGEHFTDEAKKTGTLTVSVPAKGTTTVSYRIKHRIG